MGHEMIQRMWRNKTVWLRKMVQINPVLNSGSVTKAIKANADKQSKELADIRQKILIYEANNSIAEKLTDTI